AGRVQANQVATNRITRRVRPVDGLFDIHARGSVAGDDVAGARGAATDAIGPGAILNVHSVVVSDVHGAGGVQADIVAAHQVARGAVAVNIDSLVVVAGNDVTCRGHRAAHGVVAGAVEDDHAPVVGDSAGARRIDADVVTLHQIARRAYLE